MELPPPAVQPGPAHEAKSRIEVPAPHGEEETSSKKDSQEGTAGPRNRPEEKEVKLESIIEAYEAATFRVGENVRSLSLAGFALAWILMGTDLHKLTKNLLVACLLIVAALVADFLQYLASAFVLSLVKRLAAGRGVKRDDYIDVPDGTYALSEWLYRAKILFLGAGVVVLACCVWSRIGPALTEAQLSRGSAATQGITTPANTAPAQ